ncbi:WXG100 family type VII secretion target [Brachybacterium saurashtrense]|uniref:WXG100 family type VII secretion target n=1 Tax=Brachybacterium saurashtrense TaxID=556288 RepID=UPI0013B407C9|nr:hypothetical protein [Brachybacterium saurashtrense]
MSGFFGADTAALRDYAQRVQAGSGRLQELRTSLAAQVGSVEWTGPDADAFRHDVSGRLSSLFDQVGGDLARRRAELATHAEEQDEASSVDGGAAGGASRGSGGDRSFSDALGDLLSNPLTAVGSTIASSIGAGGALWKMATQSRNLMALRAAMDTPGAAALSAQTFLRGGMVEDAAGFLGKLGGVGRFLGGAGGVLGIAGGISDMIDPPHDGWRGVGDRIAGGLSVVGGAGGLAVALGAGAALGPVGLGVVAVAGVGAGLWAAGNAIYDNWDSITEFAGDVGGHVSDFVSDAGDVVGGAVDAVGDFVGGLF